MDLLGASGLIIGIVLALPVGLLAGFMIATSRMRAQAGGKTPEELKQEMEEYRSKVDEHFVGTNDLLKGLTEQYRQVYAHMANGARDLSSLSDTALEDQLRLALLEQNPALEGESVVNDAAARNEETTDPAATADDDAPPEPALAENTVPDPTSPIPPEPARAESDAPDVSSPIPPEPNLADTETPSDPVDGLVDDVVNLADEETESGKPRPGGVGQAA